MPLVKFCGLTSVAEVDAAVRCDIAYVGFVLAQHRKQVSIERCERLCARARELGFSGKLVGVFVDPPPRFVRTAAEVCGLDVLQFHGAEDEDILCHESGGRALWKAIRVRKSWNQHSIREALMPLPRGVIPLFDSYCAEDSGSTGRMFDHSILRGLASMGPFILAGGLDAMNVQAAIRATSPHVVDVSSGVESGSGCKCPIRMAAFAQAVRSVASSRACGWDQACSAISSE